MKKTRKPAVKVKVTGRCYVFSSQPMVCPFCRTTVPANTEHRCEKKS
jgi:hypothetical protein